MLFELRTYDLKPGTAPVYLQKFRTEGVGLITRHLPLGGYWMTESGELNRLYHLWIYESAGERDACRAKAAADKAWMQGFIPDAFQNVVSQRNCFMRLAKAGLELETVIAARRSYHGNQPVEAPMFAPGLHSVAIHRHIPDVITDTVAIFETMTGSWAGEHVTLSAGPFDTICANSAGAILHEIIRPLSLSPLR